MSQHDTMTVKTGDRQDHRNAPRLRTLKGATIVLDNGNCTLGCTLRNLSETGALLLVGSMTVLPSQFNLIINNSKEQRLCRIAWRDDTRVGVSFTGKD